MIELCNRELICKICGFITFSYKDMVEHLAQYEKEGRMKVENCEQQIIKYGAKSRKNDKKQQKSTHKNRTERFSWTFLLLAVCFLMFFSLNSVSGVEFTFQKGQNVSLIQIANATQCNITSIIYSPNSTTLLSDLVMTKRGVEFNYTFLQNYTQSVGRYIVSGECDHIVWAYDFDINIDGVYSTQEKTDTTNTGVYFLFGIGALLFIGFLFIEKPIFKWSFFLVSILFIVIGINVVAISIYNDLGDTPMGNIFDQIGAGCYYMYYLIGGLFLFIWVLTTIASIADRKRMKQAEDAGLPVDFGSYR